MKLTVEGIAHWEEITLVVFQYLEMLKASEFPEWIFEELKALADISFRFQEENSAVEKCEEIAEIMQEMYQVPAQDLLRYDLFEGPFEKQLVADMLEQLTPENLFISLTSRKLGENPEFQAQVRLIDCHYRGCCFMLTSNSLDGWLAHCVSLHVVLLCRLARSSGLASRTRRSS